MYKYHSKTTEGCNVYANETSVEEVCSLCVLGDIWLSVTVTIKTMSHASASTNLSNIRFHSSVTGEKMNFWNVLICFWVSEFEKLSLKWPEIEGKVVFRTHSHSRRCIETPSVMICCHLQTQFRKSALLSRSEGETYHSWEMMASSLGWPYAWASVSENERFGV